MNCMLGLVLGALAGFFESVKDVLSKKSLKHVNEYTVAFSLRFFALIFLIPALLIAGIPPIGDSFIAALALNGFLNLIVTVVYLKAIKHSDLSITLPMLTFTPLFLLITSPLIVGEFPNSTGVAGILLIVFGAYSMKIGELRNGYFAPFRALMNETGPRLMLLAAFIWSITSNLDKIGVMNSSPIFWAAAVNAFIAVFLLPLAIHKSRAHVLGIPKKLHILAPIGLLSALALVAQMTAIKLTLVAYVISLKRAGILFGVIWGWLIFREKGIKERLFGATIMVLGVVLIALS